MPKEQVSHVFDPYNMSLSTVQATGGEQSRRGGDGRKAKRALRRRMKLEQQRCNERMLGPGRLFEAPTLPQLGRGGDGLALSSLRPSLVQERYNKFRTSAADSPRRPATASNMRSGPRLRSTPHGDVQLPLRSSSAPPTPAGNRETAGAFRDEEMLPRFVEICDHTSKDGDEILQQEPSDTFMENISTSRGISAAGSESEIPVPPVVGRSRGCDSRRVGAGGRRTTRLSSQAATSASSTEKTKAWSHENHHEHVDFADEKQADAEDPSSSRWDVKERNIPTRRLSTESDATSDNTDDCIKGSGQQHIQSQSGERSATLVFSSVAPLSPRGRSRTPVIVTPLGRSLSPRAYEGEGGDALFKQSAHFRWASPPQARSAYDKSTLTRRTTGREAEALRYQTPCVVDGNFEQYMTSEVWNVDDFLTSVTFSIFSR